jgi:outer membrane protein OmpA-like peptidoglycan-associated protein/predicted regulator of Ras-like GTPase activity (Roadblock/LC7/MglB family)
MSQSSEQTPENTDEQQMRALRKLIFGESGQVVKQLLQENARQVVSEVFSEALFDREKQDGSVNKVILPLVEKSVERSVTNHSEQMVGYLYPIVGSLARKSVAAFITDILEKTNSLIENSLSFKSLVWRFKAKQAGVSFSQYVAAQTFLFRVEQVFLIHRETGLLLNTLSVDLQSSADADLISAMLTAINDFVSDSFNVSDEKGEQQLDVVKTDDFTLLLKQGPKAILVAAISGNAPQKVANQLQLSLEEIHRLYAKELNHFSGDASVFVNSEQQLRDCLLAELKTEQSKTKKRPWIALFIVFSLSISACYAAFLRWQANEVLAKVSSIDEQPGIVLTSAQLVGFSTVQFNVLRDPQAVSIPAWLAEQQLSETKINYKERAYVSVDPDIIRLKVQSILSLFPGVEVEWQGTLPIFIGEFSNLDKLRLQAEFNKVTGLDFKTSWLDPIKIAGIDNNAADDPAIMRAILDLNIAKLERHTIKFEPAASTLTEQNINTLIVLKEEFNQLLPIAEQQELSLGLIIMGASDSTGSSTFNKALSQKRANAVKHKLEELGIDKNRLNAIGLGVIELKTSGDGARKVLFNVVYFDAS